jgi:hypothetical protein
MQTDLSLPPLPARLLGVITAPARLFDELADLPPDRVHWLLPPLLYILCAVACMTVIVGQPGPAAQLQEITATDFLPQLDAYVSGGTITADQAAAIRSFITPGSAGFILLQIVGTTAVTILVLVLLAALLWLITRSVLGRTAPFRKVLEVSGLSFVIGILERIVTTALVVATGSIFATPGPGVFVVHSPQGQLFLALSSINLFTIWEIGVVSAGLSALTGRDWPKVFVLLLALWALWTLVMLLPVLLAGIP